MTTEPTQLHYITRDELRLLQSYRLMDQQIQVAIMTLAELQAEPQASPRIGNGGNVVPIRPAPTA